MFFMFIQIHSTSVMEEWSKNLQDVMSEKNGFKVSDTTVTQDLGGRLKNGGKGFWFHF